MTLMGGGIWGVGYGLVSMRVRKLLKRLAATPMSRWTFLGSFLLHRVVLAAVEIAFLLAFARLAFGVAVTGSFVALAVVGLAGTLAFGGLGLLIASRARNMETASGLMNLASLPMWLLSGVFFATTNFPAWMRPVVKGLPLTALNDGLRSVVLDGAGLASVGLDVGILVAWTTVTFGLALRWFRWS
jgi:ABC-type multidrug transport system permease subunit